MANGQSVSGWYQYNPITGYTPSPIPGVGQRLDGYISSKGEYVPGGTPEAEELIQTLQETGRDTPPPLMGEEELRRQARNQVGEIGFDRATRALQRVNELKAALADKAVHFTVGKNRYDQVIQSLDNREVALRGKAQQLENSIFLFQKELVAYDEDLQRFSKGYHSKDAGIEYQELQARREGLIARQKELTQQETSVKASFDSYNKRADQANVMYARLQEQATGMEDVTLRMKAPLVRLKAHEIESKQGEEFYIPIESTYRPARIKELPEDVRRTFYKTRAEVGIPIAAEVLGGVAAAGEITSYIGRGAAQALIPETYKETIGVPMGVETGIRGLFTGKPGKLTEITIEPRVQTKGELVMGFGTQARVGGELLATATIFKGFEKIFKPVVTKAYEKSLKIKPTKTSLKLTLGKDVSTAKIRSVGASKIKTLTGEKDISFSIKAKALITKTKTKTIEPIENTLKKIVSGFQDQQPFVKGTSTEAQLAVKKSLEPITTKIIGKIKTVSGGRIKIKGLNVKAIGGKVTTKDFGTTTVSKPIGVLERIKIQTGKGFRLFETKTGVSATYTGQDIGIGKYYQKLNLSAIPSKSGYRYTGYSDVAAFKKFLSFGGEKTRIGISGTAKIKATPLVTDTSKFFKVIKAGKKTTGMKPLTIQTQVEPTLEKSVAQLMEASSKATTKAVASEAGATVAGQISSGGISFKAMTFPRTVSIPYEIPAQPQFSYMLPQQFKAPAVLKIPALTTPIQGVKQIQLQKMKVGAITMTIPKMASLEKQMTKQTQKQLQVPSFSLTQVSATSQLEKQLQKQASRQSQSLAEAIAAMSATAQAKATATATGLKLKTPTITIQKLKMPYPYTPWDWGVTVPPPPPPFFWLPPGKKKSRWTMTKEKKTKAGWFVFGKRFGEYKAISTKPVTKLKALGIGATWADITAGATFKIVPAGKPAIKTKLDLSWAKLASKFYAKDQHTFIEKTKHRISTIGEKEEITFKGLEAIKFKKLSLGGEKKMAKKKRKKTTKRRKKRR